MKYSRLLFIVIIMFIFSFTTKVQAQYIISASIGYQRINGDVDALPHNLNAIRNRF